MQEDKKYKLRIKLKTGEEFEAEGNESFVSAQKEEFFKIIGVKKAPQGQSPAQTEGFIYPRDPHSPPPPSASFTPVPDTRTFIPAYKKRNLEPHNYREPRQNPAGDASAAPPEADAGIWAKTAYTDGQYIVIRRKSRYITPALAALIILAAAKMLRGIPSFSAIDLAKSMKFSGYFNEGGRLDRIIAPDIKEKNIVFEGEKRNRVYIITPEGMAKAYRAAEKALPQG